MTKVTFREASRAFSKITKIARGGETVCVTRNGEPWVTIVAPGVEHKSRPVVLPDFIARLKKDFSGTVSGPSMAEMISEGRGE